MTPAQRLGARIKQLRKEKGMTQTRVARILKTHQAAVCRIERGQQSLAAVQLPVLAKGLGVVVGKFFTGRR